MRMNLPDKVVHYGGSMRYRPSRPLFRKVRDPRPGLHISVQASIAITRQPEIIEISAQEEAAEDDPRGRIVDIIT